jgi:hypothetical protein
MSISWGLRAAESMTPLNEMPRSIMDDLPLSMFDDPEN